MCRSVIEGGRRCPHDGNDGRRARRINSNLKDALKDNVDTIVVATVSKDSDDNVYSINDIKKEIEEFEKLKNELEELSSLKKPWNGEANGVKYPNLNQAFKALKSQMESTTRSIGEKISQIAHERTGHSAKDIAYYANSRQLELEETYVSLQKEELELRQQVVERLKLSSPTFAFDSLAKAHFDNEEDEELSALYEKRQNIEKKISDNSSELRIFKSQLDKKYWSMVSKNQESYLSVLKELRDFGGELQTSEDSHDEKSEILKEAAAFYPSSWIEKSNSLTPMKVKATQRRAHYNGEAAQTTINVIPMERIVIRDHDYKPSGKKEIGMYKVEPDEDGICKAVLSSQEEVEHYITKNESLWIQPVWEFPSPYTHRYDANGKPKGNGWEEVEITETVLDSETNQEKLETTKIWRRQSKKRVTKTVNFSAEILVDSEPADTINKRNGWNSAIHELAHRMEDAQPTKYLSIMEQEFYDRRTTLSDGNKMKEIRLYKGKNEFGIPDDFVSDYMGKNYEDKKYFEILSTGMESVFGSSYGNLNGVTGRKADKDMRNFILGLLSVI